MSGVVLSERQASVRWITINRPERHNALDRETILALRDAVLESGQESETRVVVITGAGQAFCSGADLRAGRSEQASSEDVLEVGFNATIRAIWNLPKPVIAAVGGIAAGYGTFRTVVAEYAERLAKNAPLALAAIKTSMHQALSRELDEVLTDEMDRQRRLSQTEDVREGIAAFLEKREPVYKGR